MPTWTAPSTWATGTIVTSTFLDAQIQGNMEYLGTTHAHSTGTSGEGAGYIGPVSYMDAKGAAVPAAPTNATLTRVFATATSFGWMGSNSSTFYFGASAHEHTIANVQSVPVQGSQGATFAGGAAIIHIISNFNTASTGTLSTAVAIGGSGSRAVLIAGGGFMTDTNPGTSKVRVELRDDGAIIATSDSTSNDQGGTASGKSAFHTTLLTDVAAGSVTYSITARRTTLTGTNTGGAMFGNWLDVREIKQQ